MTPLRVFIGYDASEPEAFAVLAHSILTRASCPVAITPLVRPSLGRIHTRERGRYDSTDFSITRFLVPYLSDYAGLSIFMDSDMLCRVDLAEILPLVHADPGKAVYVCQHAYTPSTTTKFLGRAQTDYPRKNWSSFMVFDTARCRALTPAYVNTATGLMLHRFWWTTDDRIGSLPLDWNWLVGEYPANAEAKILHYTLGGPWFRETAACDQADLWFAERDAMRGSRVQVSA